MFCCVKSSLSGLLSPTVAFMIIQTPLFKAMKVECRCRGRTALVCMAVCTGVCVCGGGGTVACALFTSSPGYTSGF